MKCKLQITTACISENQPSRNNGFTLYLIHGGLNLIIAVRIVKFDSISIFLTLPDLNSYIALCVGGSKGQSVLYFHKVARVLYGKAQL